MNHQDPSGSGLAGGLDLRPPASHWPGSWAWWRHRGLASPTRAPGGLLAGGLDRRTHLFQWFPKAESVNTLHLSLGSSPAPEFPGVPAALAVVCCSRTSYTHKELCFMSHGGPEFESCLCLQLPGWPQLNSFPSSKVSITLSLLLQTQEDFSCDPRQSWFKF